MNIEPETKPPKAIKVATLITAVLLLAVVAVGGTLINWAFQDAAPKAVLEVKNDPVPVEPVEVKDGSKVTLRIDFCKKVKHVGRVNRYLVGETGGAKIEIISLPDTTEEFCSTDLPTRVKCLPNSDKATCAEVVIPIPGQTPSDTYHVVYEIDYEINPLKSSKVIFRSQSFKVTNIKLDVDSAVPSQ